VFSVEDDESNSNSGFNVSWGDYLSGTCRDQPRTGHEAMIIGFRTFREEHVVQLVARHTGNPLCRQGAGRHHQSASVEDSA
jgi:hypothetical protein